MRRYASRYMRTKTEPRSSTTSLQHSLHNFTIRRSMKYRIVWMIDWRPYWPLSHDRTKSSFIQTGGAAAAQLLDEGRKVRAFVHREDERAEALRKRGPSSSSATFRILI